MSQNEVFTVPVSSYVRMFNSLASSLRGPQQFSLAYLKDRGRDLLSQILILRLPLFSIIGLISDHNG